jgi:hypothetical protein
LLAPNGNTVPATVTVAATDITAPTDPTTLIRPLTDVVIIARAEYDLATQTLSVEATSSDTLVPQTLTVGELGLPVPVSEVLTVPPGRVTVTSSAGGSDTEAVLVVDSTDSDGDGVPDTHDNCPVNANTDQADLDLDGIGDACDPDIDGDTVDNGLDNCPVNANADQADLDLDGIGDACDPDIDGDNVDNAADNCTLVANTDQRDSNGDNFGNVCDADFNNDCVVDAFDIPAFRTAFGSAGPDEDLNGDNIVDAFDVPLFRNAFGKAPGPSFVGACVPPLP